MTVFTNCNCWLNKYLCSFHFIYRISSFSVSLKGGGGGGGGEGTRVPLPLLPNLVSFDVVAETFNLILIHGKVLSSPPLYFLTWGKQCFY